ncbi:hypothetical protein BH23GEM10_BH23GEM10_09260 [soil metagenome]
MKRIACVVTLLLTLVASDRAAAQTPDSVPATAVDRIDDVIERSGLGTALDSLAAASAPELERALEQLSATLANVALRIVGDRELRLSAARAAHGMADVAEVVILEQSARLQDILRDVAERLAAMSAATDTTAARRQR